MTGITHLVAQIQATFAGDDQPPIVQNFEA
jgi:hypothetical protein